MIVLNSGGNFSYHPDISTFVLFFTSSFFLSLLFFLQSLSKSDVAPQLLLLTPSYSGWWQAPLQTFRCTASFRRRAKAGSQKVVNYKKQKSLNACFTND